jgi:hypothetical protein
VKTGPKRAVPGIVQLENRKKIKVNGIIFFI